MKLRLTLSFVAHIRAMEVYKMKRKIREEIPNVSKIKPEMIFKNYQELCATLEVSIVKGNVKAAQRKEWKRYFEFENISGTYQIKIISIYSVRQPKEASKRKNVYLEDMKLRLLTLMAAEGNETGLIIHRSRLAVELGLCNGNYNKYKYNLIPMLKDIYYKSNPRSLNTDKNKYEYEDEFEFDVPIDEIYLNDTLLSEKLDYEDFLQESSNAMNGWIKTLLVNLEKDGLITIDENYIIKHRGDNSYKEANPELKDKIDEIYYRIRQKFYRVSYKKFITDLNEELLILGIKRCAKVYKFNFINGVDDLVSSYRERYREGIEALERVNANSMKRFSKTDKWREIADILILKVNPT